MPRNIEENIYITIGFHRRSAVWQRLQHEADDLDISIPHLIKLLLADRAAVLDGHGKDLWFPRGARSVQVSPAASPSVSLASPATAEDDASRRALAAAAAAKYWDD